MASLIPSESETIAGTPSDCASITLAESASEILNCK